MKPTIDMAEVTRLTRLGRLDEAMAMLRGQGPATSDTPVPDASDFIDMVSGASGHWRAAFEASDTEAPAARPAKPKFANLDAFVRQTKSGHASGAGVKHPKVPTGATFTELTFSDSSGSRNYKLYQPSTYTGAATPLIIMLHGCTQSADDFAVGTRMNELAEMHGFIVAYPIQPQTANMNRCWNWFNAADQRRDQGEPALLAGITRQIMADYAIDSKRVFVAGLSAGGAMAAIMGAAYPELYAAVGVHSGLPVGAAHDMPSAFAAMSQGGTHTVKPENPVPTILFHGDADSTVHVKNGDHIVAQAVAHRLKPKIVSGTSAGGVAFTHTQLSDARETVVMEHWKLHGAGHAWAGGDSAGSYTDPKGPDASAEMIRFFLARSS